jgi:ribosomal protein L7/L12
MPGAYDSNTLSRHFQQVNERLARLEEQMALVSEKLGLPFELPTSDVPLEVVSLVREGKRLEAVKRYRELTGADFDEARSVVELL